MFLNKFLQAILWRHYAICSQPNFDDPKNRATQKWLGYAKTVLINRRFWGRWKWWEEVIFRPYVGDEVTPFNLAFFVGQNAITPPPMPSIRQRPKRAVRPSAPVKPFRSCLPSVNRQPPRPNTAPSTVYIEYVQLSVFISQTLVSKSWTKHMYSKQRQVSQNDGQLNAVPCKTTSVVPIYYYNSVALKSPQKTTNIKNYAKTGLTKCNLSFIIPSVDSQTAKRPKRQAVAATQ